MGEVAAELLYNMAPLALFGAGAGAGAEVGSCAPLLAELRVRPSIFSRPAGLCSVLLSFQVLWFDMWSGCVCVQQLWGEIGKSREERERMVHELEAECTRVYRRKVDEATGERALLHQSLAASEAEIAALTAALGAENSTQFKVRNLLGAFRRQPAIRFSFPCTHLVFSVLVTLMRSKTNPR